MSASDVVASAWSAARARAGHGRLNSLSVALLAEELLARGVVFPLSCWNCGGPVGEGAVEVLGERWVCSGCAHPCGIDSAASCGSMNA